MLLLDAARVLIAAREERARRLPHTQAATAAAPPAPLAAAAAAAAGQCNPVRRAAAALLIHRTLPCAACTGPLSRNAARSWDCMTHMWRVVVRPDAHMLHPDAMPWQDSNIRCCGNTP